ARLVNCASPYAVTFVPLLISLVYLTMHCDQFSTSQWLPVLAQLPCLESLALTIRSTIPTDLSDPPMPITLHRLRPLSLGFLALSTDATTSLDLAYTHFPNLVYLAILSQFPSSLLGDLPVSQRISLCLPSSMSPEAFRHLLDPSRPSLHPVHKSSRPGPPAITRVKGEIFACRRRARVDTGRDWLAVL
ncbi:hypothetical protein BCR44DRAFT_1438068, partial [Catenaria anguillulae PL171]